MKIATGHFPENFSRSFPLRRRACIIRSAYISVVLAFACPRMVWAASKPNLVLTSVPALCRSWFGFQSGVYSASVPSGQAFLFGLVSSRLGLRTKQFFRANGANVTRAAGDKDVHALTMKGACRSAKRKMADVKLWAP